MKLGRNLLSQLLERWFLKWIGFPKNRFHPLAWIVGSPEIGTGTVIGGFSEVYAKGANVKIGKNCDIASFVSINCSDSHLRCIGRSREIIKKDITIGDNVYIGTHCAVLGGTIIGNRSVIGAGTILRGEHVPPDSLVIANSIRPGFYVQR